MSKCKMLFVKSLDKRVLFSTEEFAREVLNDPHYDNIPFVDKGSIQRAFDLYGDKLVSLDQDVNSALGGITLNIEGHFLASNLPEIETIVTDQSCDTYMLDQILGDNQDITHIGLTAYVSGMDKTIDLIKHIQEKYPEKELYVGGVGAVYPHIEAVIKEKNKICTGEGVSFLRKHLGLSELKSEEMKITSVHGQAAFIPLSRPAIYVVTQLGCFNNCDFCITNKMHRYNPFSKSEQIINYFDQLLKNSKQDEFVVLCEPNAFNPVAVWKRVFNFFIENANSYDNKIFLFGPSSIKTLSQFDLEKIQYESPLKIFFVNYGIEKTVGEGYEKNGGDPKGMIRHMNRLGIVTNHSYIVGLPEQNSEMVDEEIRNNLEYESDFINIITFKPIPKTTLYEQLEKKNRIITMKVPPEFLYVDGYLPFDHEYFGPGFTLLEQTFKAYYENEKGIVDICNNVCNKLIRLWEICGSQVLLQLAEKYLETSRKRLPSFSKRMPSEVTNEYKRCLLDTQKRFDKTLNKVLVK